MFPSRVFFSFFSVVFLSFALLFTGCNMDDDSHTDRAFVPVGIWETDFDRYEITSNSIDYVMDNSSWNPVNDVLQGQIVRAIDFSPDAGVLIIRVNAASGPLIANTVGNYTGIYYRDFSAGSIRLANAIDLTDYSPVETDSLTEAIALFTAGNSGSHVDWSFVISYTKKAE
ncbi:MAG: hypothetical protein FWG77_11510 [Treponema sp.]|nr:hypothetical protein [Treponema sp.]